MLHEQVRVSPTCVFPSAQLWSAGLREHRMQLPPTYLPFFFCVCLLPLASCTRDREGPQGPALVEDALDQAASYAVSTEVPSERVYLGITNWVRTETPVPWHYGRFDLDANTRVLLELYDPNAWQPVGFKAYRVTAEGGLLYLGMVDGYDGYAAAVLSTKSGGSYVLESVAHEPGMTLALELSCLEDDRRCSPNLQPEEPCGTRGIQAGCEEGLYCAFAEGCGADDRGGVCARPAEVCPAVFGPEVCGCDGHTYGTACQASSAGVSVASAGACECDPLIFTKNLDAPAEVVGTWVYRGALLEEDITAALTLAADGTFAYQQTWDPQCLRAEPSCRRASRLFAMSGTFENQTFAVQLLPDPEPGMAPPPELAQSFSVETSCDGSVRLQTTELGEDRIFERDPCAALPCADDERCELREVWCLRAPCPPVPTCVAGE